MHYIYILKSLSCPGKIYVGYTNNISQRITMHNEGKSTYTDKYKPWKLWDGTEVLMPGQFDVEINKNGSRNKLSEKPGPENTDTALALAKSAGLFPLIAEEGFIE